MEEEARKRKEMLSKLKQKNQPSSEVESKPVLKFRNYVPESTLLKEKAGIEIKDDEETEEREMEEENKISKRPLTEEELRETVEAKVEGLTEKIIKEQTEKNKEELNLNNLAPAKPNWDLKRDVEKKLLKLEKRTQLKIHDLVRKRLLSKNQSEKDIKNGKELVDAINTQDQLDKAQIEEEEEED